MRVENRLCLSEEIVQQALAGSEEAWAEIYGLVKPFILGLCRGRYGLSPEESEDICQNVILQLFRTFDRIENVGAWICGAVNRQAGGVRPRAAGDAADVPGKNAADLEASIGFWHAFSSLSRECRRIIHHVIFEGLSHREAAPKIGIAAGSIHYLKAKCQETFLVLFKGGRHDG